MAKQTKINFSLDGLDNLQAEMKQYVTRVGILGSNAARDDGPMNNAEIGVIHEFGSEGAHIPPRSFLRMPMEEKRRELMKSFQTATSKAAMDSGRYREVFRILGVHAEAIVQEAFATGGFGHWPALQPSTIAAKGSSAILIDTKKLRQSITSDVVTKGQL